MERRSKLSVQNIIGRITHGLVGMDIYLNEKKSNDYLRDFLTLEENEITEVFLSMIAQNRLIPSHEAKLSDEETAFLESVKKAQKIVRGIDKVESDKEIEDCINELGAKMDIIYATIPER
jgi:hypothetical protein